MLIIVNPTASNYTLKKKWSTIEAKLKNIKSDYEIVTTEYREHGREIAKEAVNDHDIIISAGGDGTAHEVAQGIVDSGLSPQEAPSFFPLPLGSSNDVPRNLGVPENIEDAIEILNNENIAYINTIKCQGDDQPPQLCFNLGQIGLLSVFSYNAAVNREKPIFPFNIPPFSWLVREGNPNRYTLVALKYILWKYSNLQSRITFDNQDTRDIKLTILSYNVGKTYGHYKFCPNADHFGDSFATTIGNNISRFTQLRLIGLIKKEKYDKLEISEAKRVFVEVDKPIPGGADGEPYAVNATKFKLELKKKSFKVIVP